MFPAAPFLVSELRDGGSWLAVAGLFGPDAGVNRRGLVLKQRAYHLGRALPAGEHVAAGQVEGRIFRMVAGEIQQTMFAQAVNEPADAGPVDRAGAHRTGFGGRIERSAAQSARIERGAGLRREQ